MRRERFLRIAHEWLIIGSMTFIVVIIIASVIGAMIDESEFQAFVKARNCANATR